MMLLAQAQLDSVPANYLKWFVVCLVALTVVAASVVYLIVAFRKPAPVKVDDNPAIEVRKAAKRYNHELSESRHGEITRRLGGHDVEIDAIWNTMRSEDSAIRKDSHDKFNAIMLALGEIKGELKGRK